MKGQKYCAWVLVWVLHRGAIDSSSRFVDLHSMSRLKKYSTCNAPCSTPPLIMHVRRQEMLIYVINDEVYCLHSRKI
jgi:hypothetical protein